MKKGQIIAPVGSGKTRMEYETISKMIQNGSKINIVLAPRISLVHQIINEFWDNKKKTENWEMMCVCSSKASVDELYEDEDIDLSIFTTTLVSEIEQKIKDITIINDKPIVIFGTLHSANKIEVALNKMKIKADIVIFDEAHNLTQEAWEDYLKTFPCNKQLFFTATRRISKNNDGIGRGMDNTELFGEVIHYTPPTKLYKEGKIVPPRMHFVYPKTDIDLTNEKEEIRGQLMSVIGGALKHEKENPEEARIIVFCQNAPDAHNLAESDVIKHYLSDWNIDAITSLSHRMKGKKRKDIFDNFLKNKKSILFHYDIVSEGINLPGTTGILPLRELGEIKTVQGVGRTLRLNDEDRKNLKTGKISVKDRSKWKKPYGWVILPILGENYETSVDSIKNMVYNLRRSDFDYDVERMTLVEKPKGDGNHTPNYDNGDSEHKEIFSGYINDLKNINSMVIHEIEEEDTILKQIKERSKVKNKNLISTLRTKRKV